MKAKFLPLLIAMLLLSLLQPVKAVVIDDLYTIELLVSDQTTDLRLQAFNEAFRLVLAKVSGSDEAYKSPAIAELSRNSVRYVKQFSYLNRQGIDEEGGELKVLHLKVDFDQTLIEQLLRYHNFAIWGRERPSSLLVINHHIGAAVQLVAGDTESEIVDLLDLAALNMGVPILMPLMDLEDSSLLNAADVTARRFDAINIFTDRYEPDVIVVGEIVELNAQDWQGAWEARFSGQIFKWQYSAASQKVVIDQLIAYLANVLALEYALEDHQRNEQALLLSVSSMHNINHLIAVQKYLGSLNVVESVRVALISGEAVTFHLKLRNSVEDLQKLIDIGNILEQQGLPLLNAQLNGGVVISYDFIDRGVSN